MTTKKQQGFTIIEVVLVLAIAGLIFLMVFIALPALQRSQRDTQRRNDLSRLQTAITNYQTNNKGSLPNFGTQTTIDSFVNSYVKAGGDSFTDPDGTDYVVKGQTIGSTPSFDHVVYATTGAVCGSSEGTLTTGQGARKVALQMKLEGSGVACLSN